VTLPPETPMIFYKCALPVGNRLSNWHPTQKNHVYFKCISRCAWTMAIHWWV